MDTSTWELQINFCLLLFINFRTKIIATLLVKVGSFYIEMHCKTKSLRNLRSQVLVNDTCYEGALLCWRHLLTSPGCCSVGITWIITIWMHNIKVAKIVTIRWLCKFSFIPPYYFLLALKYWNKTNLKNQQVDIHKTP